MSNFSVLELCAGGGGQALGLEKAGFDHTGLIEIDAHACNTLIANRVQWNVIKDDISNIEGNTYHGVDLIAAGLPCPPFSIAGKQLGKDDERDLFPEMLRIVEQAQPRSILIENVPGFASDKFTLYRTSIIEKLSALGYRVQWMILNASDYGVPQLRPRFVLVGFIKGSDAEFAWPSTSSLQTTVSNTIGDLIGQNQWPGMEWWCERANKISPTLVGGSKKHGGPDLGPTRAKRQWEALGVDGKSLADTAPSTDFPFDSLPRLTIRMTARIQSFPDDWQFTGGKTASYRQIGNAFPPLVAEAIGTSLKKTLLASRSKQIFMMNFNDAKKPKRKGSREKLLDYFLANQGQVIEGDELRIASGNVSEWARRVRELRDEYGYQIQTHRDRIDLKPGQYLLETDKRLPVLPRSISKETRAYVFERNGYTCQMCGLAAGDPDPFNTTRTVRLTLGHIIDKSKGGSDSPHNLRAVCTNCNEGLQNTAPPKPSTIELMKMLRRATIEDQLEALKWLQRKYSTLLTTDNSDTESPTTES